MRLVVATCALLCLGPRLGARADAVRYNGRAELGAEYDTNPSRFERVKGGIGADGPSPSPLGRLVLWGDVAALLPAQQAVSASAGLAAKWFARDQVRQEDLVVGQASASWRWLVGARTALALNGAYYDVFQRGRPERRDFRSLVPTARLDLGMGERGSFALGGGYRWFTYKSQRDFSFVGATGFANYRQAFVPADDQGGADWEWSAGASLERREFRGTRCTSLEACPAEPSAGGRLDHFWVAQTELTRTGDFLAGLGVALHNNRSNSYGESLIRGVAHLRLVFLLPWQATLSGRAELVATRYDDPIPLARPVMTGTPLVSIEDESRSTLRLELARPLSDTLEAGIRYTLYTNDLRPSPVEFRRQTALLFVGLAFER